jgi:hypothetical protein
MPHAIKVKYLDEDGQDNIDRYHVCAATPLKAYRKVAQYILSPYENTPTPSDADIRSIHHDGNVNTNATLVT